MIFALLLLALAAGVSCSAQHQQSSASNQASGAPGSAQVDTGSNSSAQSEGCKLGAYSGTTPLSTLQYYVAGQEDIRGGMTCTFRINAKLPPFTFHFPGRADNTFGNLEISSGTGGGVMQTIENATDPNAIAPAKAESMLGVVDANFDGYQDLQLLITCGAKTCSYNFYLYDPRSNRFVLEKFLSGFSSPSFDPAKKQVSQGWLLSAGDSAGETYQYEDGGRYTLIRREVSTWDRSEHTVTLSTYELRNGKMELVDSKTTPF
ncbi:MAG: hypothetical protein WBF04_10095 [Candidatus Sulfotelmatobacter sp.]